MISGPEPTIPIRPRLVMSAYCFHPDGTMEERNGWQRALLATDLFDVTVLYSNAKKAIIRFEDFIPQDLPKNALSFREVKIGGGTGYLEGREATFYVGYRRWQREAYRTAETLHRSNPFTLAHTVTLCGYREPGFLHRLGIPHVWGPIGGTHNFDFRYRACLDWWSAVREYSRSVVNNYQLLHSRRVTEALANSYVMAATEAIRVDLEKNRKIDAPVDLETGIDYELPPLREPRTPNAPIKILWAGRLRAWKGLPLLFDALKDLSPDIPYEVRVLGNGVCCSKWQKYAERLGIARRFSWVPWTNYRETLEHYSWADAFVFTSLRDTSGTGLVESLAAGTPIIGLDHQGASEVMSSETAYRVPATGVEDSVRGIQLAIEDLWSNPEVWLDKSHASSQAAQRWVWRNRQSTVNSIYQQVLKGADSSKLAPQSAEYRSEVDTAEPNAATTAH